MLSTSARLRQTETLPGLKSTQSSHTRILSHNHCHRMCIGEDVGSQTPMNLTCIHTDSTFQWFYSVNFRQTPAIKEISRTQLKSSQVLPTHCVSQSLPSHVFLGGNSRSQVAKMPVYTRTVDFSLLLCSQLAQISCKHRDITESSPNWYPTHILSHNHYLPMCVCEEIGGQKSQKSWLMHTQSTLHCFYALNLRQTASNMEISRSRVHTGIPHTFCLTTSTIACVFVKKYEVKSRKKARLYTPSRLSLVS